MAGITKLISFIVLLLATGQSLHAQVKDSLAIKDSLALADSLKARQAPKPDTVKKHNPKVATIRSAIIPGWGQATNRKYWKIPIVYAAVGIPVGTFLYNRKWYTRTRDVAKMIANGDVMNYRNRVDSRFYIFFDSTIFVNPNDALISLTTYRNGFRRNMDYSLLFTLLFWGLNVVDATVDAQLRDFDVGENLSMRIRPALMEGSMTAGMSVVFSFRNNRPNRITSSR